MENGVIKWFDNDRGYGFISADGGNDVFVHRSAVKEKGTDRDLHEGEQVQFDIVNGPNGRQAANLQKLE